MISKCRLPCVAAGEKKSTIFWAPFLTEEQILLSAEKFYEEK